MIKNLTLFFITTVLATNLYGQKNAEEQTVVDEGKMLYKSEMASWYGTDIFLEKFPEKRANIGGYFSYSDEELEKCIFFSQDEIPKVLATISFDSTFNVRNTIVDISDRGFTPIEKELFTIRKTAFDEINLDTLFILYENTNFNLIPLINGDSKKVFVLTGPQKSNVVIFGNDYLLEFDKNNQLLSKKQIHRNIITTEYSSNEKKINGKEVVGTMHTHLPETGMLITSTDICTLMLYGKIAGWKTHIVICEKNMCIWSCESNSLAVVPNDLFDKIDNEQEKRKKKKKN